jgi:hypothetical protein
MRSFISRGFRGASALTVSRVEYTPIWAEPPPKDLLGEERLADELESISANSSLSVPTIGSAVDKWLAFGNDPLLDALRPGQTSVFHQAEDYMGTNLVDVTDKSRLRDSIHFWSSHYDKHFSSVIRQSRRSALNYIGSLSAPDTFEDEADKVLTGWDRDTQFRELAYLAESILKTPVQNLQKFEMAVRTAAPEAYLELMDAIGQQTQTLIPLPSASVWYYEGEARLAWCKMFKAAQADALAFFQSVLGPALGGQGGMSDKWRALAKQLAAVFEAVGAVQVERVKRQISSGLRKDWSLMSDDEKLTQCYREQETLARSIATAEFDAEDVDDKSVEWMTEQQKISDLMSKPLDGAPGVTAELFWKHTVRLDALETDYLLTDHNKRLLGAKALVALYDQLDPSVIAAKTAESFEKGRIDIAACSFIPGMNDVWCWRNYAKFGLSTVVHHTATAKRHLTYNFTDSIKMVAAAAKLFYLSRPLSCEINYASPALLRKSLVQLCASYGVDWMHSLQRTLFTDLMFLGLAEDAIKTCVGAALAPFRDVRRVAEQAELTANALSICKLSAARVVPLDGDGDETAWALGSQRTVAYIWDSPHVVNMKRNAALGDRESLRNKKMLESRGGIEVSLWKKLTPEEVQARKDKGLQLQQEAAALVQQHPQLAEVQRSAVLTASRLSGLSLESKGAQDALDRASDQWEFVTMIHDRHVLSETQTLDVVVPFQTMPNSVGERALITEGTYRLRLRAFDHEINPDHLPVHHSDATTGEFHLFDCIPQVAEEIFGSSSLTTFPGKDLVKFFSHLRAICMDVSLGLEIATGQFLTPKGEVFWEKFLELLKSGNYTKKIGAAEGLTGPQLAAESKIRHHWELYHPAATEEEWAGVRRAVLDKAFSNEKEWWLDDEMLSGTNLEVFSLPPSVRYSHDVVQCLSADGTSLPRGVPSVTRRPLARATYQGDGTLGDLVLDEKIITDANASFDEIFSAATSAIDDAHLRLCTLSASKVSEFRRATQQYVKLVSVSSEFGGKHGRTYRDAFDKAAAEVLMPSKSVEDELREPTETDRFASSTHPEQRRRLWTPRVNPLNQNLDDPTPDMKSDWNNTL